MHLTKAFLCAALLSTFGLGTPTRRHDSRDTHETIKFDIECDESCERYQRDVQAADMILIKDIVATTGWDMKTKDDLTPERVAKLAPADAQLLSGELNKYLTNHDRQDMLIPNSSREEFEKAAKEVNRTADHEFEDGIALEARSEGADCGALIEARGFIWEFISMLFMDVLYFVLGL